MAARAGHQPHDRSRAARRTAACRRRPRRIAAPARSHGRSVGHAQPTQDVGRRRTRHDDQRNRLRWPANFRPEQGTRAGGRARRIGVKRVDAWRHGSARERASAHRRQCSRSRDLFIRDHGGVPAHRRGRCRRPARDESPPRASAPRSFRQATVGCSSGVRSSTTVRISREDGPSVCARRWSSAPS